MSTRKDATRYAKLLGLDDKNDARWVFLVKAGYHWLRLAQLDRAEAVFTGACLLLRDEPDSWFGLAECFFAAGRDEAALEACGRAVRTRNISRKTMALVYNLQWQALRRLGRITEMFAAMQLVCELDPTGIGKTLLEQMRKSVRASVRDTNVSPMEQRVGLP